MYNARRNAVHQLGALTKDSTAEFRSEQGGRHAYHREKGDQNQYKGKSKSKVD